VCNEVPIDAVSQYGTRTLRLLERLGLEIL
jgi:hypothetical protein